MSKKLSMDIEKLLKDVQANLQTYDVKWRELKAYAEAQAGTLRVVEVEAPPVLILSSLHDSAHGIDHHPRTIVVDISSTDQKDNDEAVERLKNEMETLMKRVYRSRQQLMDWIANTDLKGVNFTREQLHEAKKEVEQRHRKGRIFYLKGVSSEDVTNERSEAVERALQWMSDFEDKLNEMTELVGSDLGAGTHSNDDMEVMSYLIGLYDSHVEAVSDLRRRFVNSIGDGVESRELDDLIAMIDSIKEDVEVMVEPDVDYSDLGTIYSIPDASIYDELMEALIPHSTPHSPLSRNQNELRPSTSQSHNSTPSPAPAAAAASPSPSTPTPFAKEAEPPVKKETSLPATMSSSVQPVTNKPSQPSFAATLKPCTTQTQTPSKLQTTTTATNKDGEDAFQGQKSADKSDTTADTGIKSQPAISQPTLTTFAEKRSFAAKLRGTQASPVPASSEAYPALGGGLKPAAINNVTGPSKTYDIKNATMATVDTQSQSQVVPSWSQGLTLTPGIQVYNDSTTTSAFGVMLNERVVSKQTIHEDWDVSMGLRADGGRVLRVAQGATLPVKRGLRVNVIAVNESWSFIRCCDNHALRGWVPNYIIA